MPDDYYVSQYSGEGIDERLTAAHNAVRYDTTQTITDAQKTQARSNIAAAPDGYGLGGIAKLLTAADDLNNIGTTGWYCYHNSNQPANVPTPAIYSAVMEVIFGYYSGQTVQRVYSTGDNNDWNLVAQRVFYRSGGWQPWEWVNPPMALGVEYRTTERYLGKPVYCQVVDFGTAPNNGTKNVSLSGMNIDQVCGAIFHYYSISSDENGVITCHPDFTGFLVSNYSIHIVTNTDKTDTKLYVTIKYTKTTD